MLDMSKDIVIRATSQKDSLAGPSVTSEKENSIPEEVAVICVDDRKQGSEGGLLKKVTVSAIDLTADSANDAVVNKKARELARNHALRLSTSQGQERLVKKKEAAAKKKAIADKKAEKEANKAQKAAQKEASTKKRSSEKVVAACLQNGKETLSEPLTTAARHDKRARKSCYQPSKEALHANEMSVSLVAEDEHGCKHFGHAELGRYSFATSAEMK